MQNDNFDFGGDIEDDADVNSRNCTESEETALSVYGLLISRLGYKRGKDAYDALLRVATKAAKQNNGTPGVLFDVDGGRFVAVQPVH